MAFKLKVLAGSHRIGSKYETKEGRKVLVKEGVNIGTNQTFESGQDLSLTYPEKFARVDTVEQASSDKTEEQATYESMSMEELKRLAVELEIKVSPNINKKDLIAKIQEVADA